MILMATVMEPVSLLRNLKALLIVPAPKSGCAIESTVFFVLSILMKAIFDAAWAVAVES